MFKLYKPPLCLNIFFLCVCDYSLWWISVFLPVGEAKAEGLGERTIVAMDTGRSKRSWRSTCMLG